MNIANANYTIEQKHNDSELMEQLQHLYGDNVTLWIMHALQDTAKHSVNRQHAANTANDITCKRNWLPSVQ